MASNTYAETMAFEGTDLSEENEDNMPARGDPMGKNLSTIGLYYPFIHFKNDAWLKLAAVIRQNSGRVPRQRVVHLRNQ
jgi:hypothetical protein